MSEGKTRTITLKFGDPCPWCGEIEPHDRGVRFSDEWMTCGPTATNAAASEVASASWMGLVQARQIVGPNAELDAEIARMEAIGELGRDRNFPIADGFTD